MTTSNSGPPEPLRPLAALFLKTGVAIGGLSDAQRRLVLALVWSGLPAMPMTERAINAALVERLAGAAAFLGTDHVELRRWLVDAGWLGRDDYGREYRRVEPHALPGDLQPLAAAFAGLDTDALAATTRAAHAAAREQRRRAWDARQGAA
jgi:Uncharacterized protein conserved in bacteria (DUF2087)